MFCGVAIGPVIGGILINATGSALSPFYLALTVHALYATYIFLIVPESQTKARATGVRQRRQVSLERRHDLSRVRAILKRAIWFLSPLAVLMPERVVIGGNPLKRSKRDWSLFFIAASYGITATLLVGLIIFCRHLDSYTSFTTGYDHIPLTIYIGNFQVVARNCKRELKEVLSLHLTPF